MTFEFTLNLQKNFTLTTISNYVASTLGIEDTDTCPLLRVNVSVMPGVYACVRASWMPNMIRNCLQTPVLPHQHGHYIFEWRNHPCLLRMESKKSSRRWRRHESCHRHRLHICLHIYKKIEKG